MPRTPVSLSIDKNGALVVLCDDGSIFTWRVRPARGDIEQDHFDSAILAGQVHTLPFVWHPHPKPVPGTASDPSSRVVHAAPDPATPLTRPWWGRLSAWFAGGLALLLSTSCIPFGRSSSELPPVISARHGCPRGYQFLYTDRVASNEGTVTEWAICRRADLVKAEQPTRSLDPKVAAIYVGALVYIIAHLRAAR